MRGRPVPSGAGRFSIPVNCPGAGATLPRVRLALLLLALLPATAGAAGFAVVELFTSEGCSSCPPADRLLMDLSTRPGVYALEFHVDYWNSLGWRDPYSAAAYSDRQRAYGDDIYTPQMVVNGTNLFVGSNRARAEAAIASALGVTPAVTLHARLDGNRLNYRETGAPEGARLCVAVLDPRRTTRVLRGENAGHTLEHARVVRGFASERITGEGSVALPAAVNRGSVVAFVQDPRTNAILGAAELKAP